MREQNVTLKHTHTGYGALSRAEHGDPRHSNFTTMARIAGLRPAQRAWNLWHVCGIVVCPGEGGWKRVEDRSRSYTIVLGALSRAEHGDPRRTTL